MKYAINSFLLVNGLSTYRLCIEIAYCEEIVYEIRIKNVVGCVSDILGIWQGKVCLKDERSDIFADIADSFDKTAIQVFTQFAEYFLGRRETFTFKFSCLGTAFQQAVWKTIWKIPFGRTVSYSELATLVGKPKACRAVAKACHDNPLPLCIPCHRVIAKNGLLGGYAYGLPLKVALLNLEKSKKDRT